MMKKTKATHKQAKPAPQSSAQSKQNPGAETVTFSFGRENYRLLIIGLLVIALGFVLMIGGGSEDPNVFSDKIFNFQRLTLAPILILAGFIIEIFAIMKKPKS